MVTHPMAGTMMAGTMVTHPMATTGRVLLHFPKRKRRSET